MIYNYSRLKKQLYRNQSLLHELHGLESKHIYNYKLLHNIYLSIIFLTMSTLSGKPNIAISENSRGLKTHAGYSIIIKNSRALPSQQLNSKT